MKLEVGKDYVARGGWRAKVVADDLTQSRPILVVHYRPHVTYDINHYIDGTVCHAEDLYDLIAEWAEPLECWVAYLDGVKLCSFSTKELADAWMRTQRRPERYIIRHMREVADAHP